MPTDRAELLRSHLEQVLVERSGDRGFETAEMPGLESLSSFAADDEEATRALEGLDHLRAGTEIAETEASALEAIVLPRERPVIDVINDTFHEPMPPWQHLAQTHPRHLIESAIPAVGRIEVPGHPSIPYAGTGFVVGEDVIMTNRHVAALFTRGIGVQQLSFIPGLEPGIDFKQEIIPSPPVILDVTEILMVHPYWDCALLRVTDLSIPPLPLDGREPDDLERDIVVIGFPAQDGRNDLALQNRIFRGIYQRKRLQPGRLRPRASVGSFGKAVDAVTHDSSTLGGNSGSVVLDVATGRVVGLHFAGRYLEANYAVPTWELAKDQRVWDAGVAFAMTPPPSYTPPWIDYWSAADPEGSPEPVTVPPDLPPPREPRSSFEWFESLDDADLRFAIREDRDTALQRLSEVFDECEANEIITDLGADETEGLFDRLPDPALPEILYLHGIMGGHLADDHGNGDRIWLDALRLAATDIAGKMMLDDDGVSPPDPSHALGADGHIRVIYGKAARKWRRERFAVHEIAYDWRKPIHTAADQLHHIIEREMVGNPNRRFVIVAHSMGGLVAAEYARRHDVWRDRIEHAILVGSPLGGSYAPIEAVLGTYPFLRAMAAVSIPSTIEDLQLLCSTLPGLIEMMPNPDLFVDPLDYYQEAAWPAGPQPTQRWLDASRGAKDGILGSPLLVKTTGVVSREHATVASVQVDPSAGMQVGPRNAPGDGTVPLRASAVAQLQRVFEGPTERHATLLRDGAVINGVVDLIKTGTTTHLRPLAVDDVDSEAVLAEEAIEIPFGEEGMAGIRNRMNTKRLSVADVEWLFDPLGGPPPP